MPHNSNTAATPKIITRTLIALIIQLIKSLDNKSPTDLITTDKGPIT